MFVIKRDGSKQPFNKLKVQNFLLKISYGLDLYSSDKSLNSSASKGFSLLLSPSEITDKLLSGIYPGVTTAEITTLLSEILANLTINHPDYSIWAARVLVSDLYKTTKDNYEEVAKLLYYHYDYEDDSEDEDDNDNYNSRKHIPIISREIFDIVQEHKDIINRTIDYSRDFEFNYFGFKTLQKSYLLKNTSTGKIIERPQHLFMRVSLGIHGTNIRQALETYDLMSRRYFIHASPTLFNAGTLQPQMSSCFLISMTDDSIEGIFETLQKAAVISKHAGGIGLHIHNIRSTGSPIRRTNGISSGIVPMLRVFNNTARYVDQGGNKRPGAIAIYLEPWHGDIFEFLNLRKNHGKEEVRARDLFYALWIEDLFMERVENDEEWTLFSPNDVPGLSDHYGKDFKTLYEKAENDSRLIKKKKVVKAQKLWYAILEAQIETGGPFILYKDACNQRSNQKNLGTIKSSNLCCEIIEYSSKDEIAVCNLASIALPMFTTRDTETTGDNNKTKTSNNQRVSNSIRFDYQKLHQIAKTLVKNLNAIIDRNFYPLIETQNSNFRHRPIAIGVQGLADLFQILRIPFESSEAKILNANIFETIYHGAVEASIELAEKLGPYETFKGSPISDGQFQFDLWNKYTTNDQNKITQENLLWDDWNLLKTKVKKSGIRNSLLVAPMPTASTSQILGFNESFEPFTSNLYTRRVLSGEFQMINQYLVRDLIKLGKWNNAIKNLIIHLGGSIQQIKFLPPSIKKLYKTVWEIPQKVLINLAVGRSPFIDQSQSLNIYLQSPTMNKLTSMHFYGWKNGLKTGMYYLRTLPAARAIQFTVNTRDLRVFIDLENDDINGDKKEEQDFELSMHDTEEEIHKIIGEDKANQVLAYHIYEEQMVRLSSQTTNSIPAEGLFNNRKIGKSFSFFDEPGMNIRKLTEDNFELTPECGEQGDDIKQSIAFSPGTCVTPVKTPELHLISSEKSSRAPTPLNIILSKKESGIISNDLNEDEPPEENTDENYNIYSTEALECSLNNNNQDDDVCTMCSG